MSKKQMSDAEALSIFGRLGGSTKSRKKAVASARNGRLGGRPPGPRRVCKHCGEPVKGGHVDPKLDATCGQHGWKLEKAE